MTTRYTSYMNVSVCNMLNTHPVDRAVGAIQFVNVCGTERTGATAVFTEITVVIYRPTFVGLSSQLQTMSVI